MARTSEAKSRLRASADVHFSSSPFIVDESVPRVIFRETSIQAATEIRAVYREIASSLEFPDYFGENLDALYECLTDMSWLSAEAYVVVLTEAENAWSRMPLAMGRMVNTWLDAALYWREQGIPMKLAFRFREHSE